MMNNGFPKCEGLFEKKNVYGSKNQRKKAKTKLIRQI